MEDKELNAELSYSQTEKISDNEHNYYTDFYYELKTQYRFLRKHISRFVRKQLKKNIKKVLYITEDDFSGELINFITCQYPDKKIIVLIPLFDEHKRTEKLLFSFEYYLQNKKHTAKIYKLKKDENYIEVIGIFSDTFFELQAKENFRNIKYLSPFIKCARITAKKLKPDMIHSNNIPFFLGSEFELAFYPIKVFQQINDLYDLSCIEPFWGLLNIVDKKGMKKICKDKVIKKCIASLFNQHTITGFSRLRECLDFIYKNYIDFRLKINKTEDIDENIIFNKLNNRILELFPQIFNDKSCHYSPWSYSLKRADYWAVLSKTYYDRIYSNPNLSYGLHDRIINTKYKSGYVSIKLDKNLKKIKFPFSLSDFREKRKLNKEYLQKEFSEERLKTKFTSESLFFSDELKTEGFLDSFSSAPLFFIQFTKNSTNEEVKLGLASIFKMIEMNKLIRFIINYTDIEDNDYLNQFIDFCKQHNSLNGKWLYLKGEINLPQFLSAADIILIPKINNPIDSLQLLAIKFGCIPIVTNNGLFNDTIFDILDNMTIGCGFKTKNPIDISTNDYENEYIETVLKGLNTFSQNPSIWNSLIKNALNYNTDWDFKTIEQYNNIYEELI